MSKGILHGGQHTARGIVIKRPLENGLSSARRGGLSKRAMEIQQSEADGAAVLALSGEIDLHASPALRATLHALAGAKTPALLLDFTNVTYIDSSGLATLVEYVRDARTFGGKILLFGLQPKVKMLFELVRLNELFTITESRESALAAAGAA